LEWTGDIFFLHTLRFYTATVLSFISIGLSLFGFSLVYKKNIQTDVQGDSYIPLQGFVCGGIIKVVPEKRSKAPLVGKPNHLEEPKLTMYRPSSWNTPWSTSLKDLKVAPSSCRYLECGGMEPGVIPPMSAWCPRLATKNTG